MNSALSNLIGSFSSMLYRVPAVIIAFTIHEFMHAYVAVKAGDNTPLHQGRYTLNPLKHIDPIGFLMVILVGIGWAKPVQVNINNLNNKRKDFVMVSLAGVFGNFLIAAVISAILFFSWDAIYANEILFNLLYYTMMINFMLIWFNLIPIPPLDGFNVLTTLVRFKNMNMIYNIRKYGFVVLILLMFTGVLRFYISGMTNLVLNGLYALYGLIQNLAGMI